MTDAARQRILALAAEAGHKLTGSYARDIIAAWLVTDQHADLDRWGYYHAGEYRWDLGRSVVRKQVKTSGGWMTVARYDLIDLAATLMKSAGSAAGVEILEKRKVAKARAVTKREDEALRHQAAILASKWLQKHERAAVLDNVLGRTMPQDEITRLRQVRDETIERYLGDLRAGRDTPADEAFASVDHPPVVPVKGPINYLWQEQQDGVAYSVRVEHKDRDTAVIAIGKQADWMAIDPLTHRATMYTGPDLVGDGGADGTLRIADGQLAASLFLVTAAKKRGGAGTRLLKLWCRMMRGYGIERWIGEAVGDEGMALLRSLERDGKIAIEAQRDSYLLIRCT